MSPEDALRSLSGSWDIRTTPEHNYFIPQDAQLSPRRGLLDTARDYIYGTEAGRRAMSAVDMWNSLTGGVRGTLGNVAPGASQAVTPALEQLVKEGVISKAPNLLGGERGFFMDPMGDVYDLGSSYSVRGLEHSTALDRIGAIPSGDRAMIPQALNDLDLIRIRQMRGGTGIPSTYLEMTKMPSNAAMEQLISLLERRPQEPVSMDLHRFGANPGSLGKHYPNASEAIDAIYRFFGK